ncbi:MAG: TMEM14 family protein, partial [Spartobacteria bacterium]
MFAPTKIYFIIFGLITIAGGVMGYVKAGSTASLIAGSISGILLLVAAFLLPSHVMVGLAIGGIVSLLLAVQFLPAFFRTGKMMPAGMMSLLSILGIVFAIAAWMR